jgi:hypothetical protein
MRFLNCRHLTVFRHEDHAEISVKLSIFSYGRKVVKFMLDLKMKNVDCLVNGQNIDKNGVMGMNFTANLFDNRLNWAPLTSAEAE